MGLEKQWELTEGEEVHPEEGAQARGPQRTPSGVCDGLWHYSRKHEVHLLLSRLANINLHLLYARPVTSSPTGVLAHEICTAII